MTRPAYYNEIDPRAAAWLRALIAGNHIAPGHVDERSIRDVTPADLAGFAQCHFFAGIGVWSAALRGAGWPDDRVAWTGSCPCQPFSDAGRGDGFADERHLWPEFFRLIAECRPDIVFGEQVASKDGLAWLDLVYADLEGAGYAVGSADLCAAGVGAPHIRQRLYWVADAGGHGARQHARELPGHEGEHGERTALGDHASVAGGAACLMVDAERAGLEGHGGDVDDGDEPGWLGALAAGPAAATSNAGGMVDAAGGTGDGGIHRGAQDAASRPHEEAGARGERAATTGAISGPGATNGHWRAADWLLCRDGRWRPVEPGTFPLAHGAPERVGRLRGYGNAINLPLATAFVEAFLEARAALGLVRGGVR